MTTFLVISTLLTASKTRKPCVKFEHISVSDMQTVSATSSFPCRINFQERDQMDKIDTE